MMLPCDVESCTPREIDELYQSYVEQQRMRADQLAMLGLYIIAPHSKDTTFESVRPGFGWPRPDETGD